MSFLKKLYKRPKKKEDFKISSTLDRLEEEGFKPLIKSDILEGRLSEVHKALEKMLVEDGEKQVKFKGELVDSVFRLIFVVSSAWLRSMDNPWLAHKINCYIQNYRELRNSPEFLDVLFEESMAMLNLSFTNIDVEPLRPIIIQTMPQFGGGWPTTMPTSGGKTSETYEPKPKGGPYKKEMSSKVE